MEHVNTKAGVGFQAPPLPNKPEMSMAFSRLNAKQDFCFSRSLFRPRQTEHTRGPIQQRGALFTSGNPAAGRASRAPASRAPPLAGCALAPGLGSDSIQMCRGSSVAAARSKWASEARQAGQSPCPGRPGTRSRAGRAALLRAGQGAR